MYVVIVRLYCETFWEGDVEIVVDHGSNRCGELVLEAW